MWHSVLRNSSAHNKGGPPDINIAQILHLSNFFELKRSLYSFTSIANQKSVRYSVSISYFTNIAVQNVNKVRACAHAGVDIIFKILTCIDLIVVYAEDDACASSQLSEFNLLKCNFLVIIWHLSPEQCF